MFERVLRAELLSLGFCLLAAATSLSAATAVKQPKPPTQLCVNSNCVNTPDPAGPHQIKWNPGHYMASQTVIYGDETLSKVTPELNDLTGWDQITGYRLFIAWSQLEPSQGNYNFAVLDSVLQRLKTGYSKPKHLVVVVLPGKFSGHMGSNDDSSIPAYLTSNSAYGPSPVSGSFGWWGINANGVSTGMYCAALYRPAVMDRFIALIQAMGKHYDSDPDFEAFMVQEDSWYISSWKGAVDMPKDPAIVTQLQRMLTAATTAFPHTAVAMQNSWLITKPPTLDFQQWLVANRISPSSADSVGQSAFDNYSFATSGLSWGLQLQTGLLAGAATPSLSAKSRMMMDVESGNISGPWLKRFGGPFTPLDITNAMNQTYHASHVFWTHFGKGSPVPAESLWTNLAAVVSAHPLTNTDYPANYP